MNNLVKEVENRLAELETPQSGQVLNVSEVPTFNLEKSVLRSSLLIYKGVDKFSWTSSCLAAAMIVLAVIQLVLFIYQAFWK